MSWRGYVLNPVPTPAPARADRGRRAWRALVRTLRHPSLAVWALGINAVALFLVLFVLLAVLRALQTATCVIGGENLIQCLPK